MTEQECSLCCGSGEVEADCLWQRSGVITVACPLCLQRQYEAGEKKQAEVKAELLEALEDMVGIFESWIRNEYDGTDTLDSILEDADFARELIAKAKGEEKPKVPPPELTCKYCGCPFCLEPADYCRESAHGEPTCES